LYCIFRTAAVMCRFVMCLLSLASGQILSETDSMLQIQGSNRRAAEDCSKGGCKPGGPPKPSNISVCQGDSISLDPENQTACFDEICKNGTVIDFHSRSIIQNNLGGMGPDTGEQKIHWKNIGKVNHRSFDLIVTTPDASYYDENANLPSYKDRYGRYIMSGPEFIHHHQGVKHGAGTIASSAPEGNWTFHFNFVWSGSQKPAIIPLLPFTFYDIDGGVETTTTCDAHSSIVHKQSNLTGGCAGGCCKHTSATPHEIAEPDNWDEELTKEQLQASVTYIMRNRSEFEFTWSQTYKRRIFFFKGSRVLACEWAR